MRYRTPGAFRHALETRLRDRSLEAGLPLTRLRKMVAFDRFLARLVDQAPGAWIIKRGYALQLRLGDVARMTRDIDAAVAQPIGQEEASARLRSAASQDLGDWFEFEVGEPAPVSTGAPQGGLRFPIRCLLDGRTFESFHLDLGQGDPVLGRPEMLTGLRFLEFAGVGPSKVPCCPLTTQIAEKVHAYTRPYTGGQSSRVRDLVDILLIASMGGLSGAKLSRALKATFEARATHQLPKELPKPPAGWSRPYNKLARQLRLGWLTVDEAGKAAARLLNPALRGTAKGRWTADSWQWRE